MNLNTINIYRSTDIYKSISKAMTYLVKANDAAEQGNNFSLSDYYYAQNSGLNLSFCFEYYIKGKSEHYIAKAFLELLRVCKTLKVEFANPKESKGKGKASLESFNDQVFKCIQQLSLYNPEISEHDLKVVVLTAMLYIMDIVVDNEIKLVWIIEKMQELKIANKEIA